MQLQNGLYVGCGKLLLTEERKGEFNSFIEASGTDIDKDLNANRTSLIETKLIKLQII